MNIQRKKQLNDFYSKLYHLHIKYVDLDFSDKERSAAFIDEADDLANRQITGAPSEDVKIFRNHIRVLIAGLERASYERGDL